MDNSDRRLFEPKHVIEAAERLGGRGEPLEEGWWHVHAPDDFLWAATGNPVLLIDPRARDRQSQCELLLRLIDEGVTPIPPFMRRFQP
jgi:hypothetical protein